ncbi:MAG: hypothetical protein WA581_21220 [Candidatus Acidiferrales bacterium]
MDRYVLEEDGVLVIDAISSGFISSWKRSTSTSRKGAGTRPSNTCILASLSCWAARCSGDSSARAAGSNAGASSPGVIISSKLLDFFLRCQSITRLRAIVKSHASNLHLPLY